MRRGEKVKVEVEVAGMGGLEKKERFWKGVG